MRAKSGILVVILSALSFVICAAPVSQAQATAASPATPAAAPASALPTVSSPPVAAEVAGQDSAEDLSVDVGRSILVDFTQPLVRQAVGMPDIAFSRGISPTEIMLVGKTPGQTSLTVWLKNGDRQFFSITVRRNTYETNDRLNVVRRELALELPGQEIKVNSENASIFLRGNVKDIDSAKRAVAIAETALAPISNSDVTGKTGTGGGGGGGKVINLLYVDVPPAEKQIMIKVRFASIDRSKSESLGFNIFSLGLGNTVGGISTQQFSAPTITSPTTGSTTTSNGVTTVTPAQPATTTFTNELNILAMMPGNLPFGVDIDALESSGIAEVLSEPNEVVSNGQQASFLAGGEYPFPVAQASGGGSTVTIMWKEYGVRLNCIPTITPRGTIRLQLAPEVSALDWGDAVSVGGSSVPALTVRRIKTEVELAEGQSFVIGGLLSNTENQSLEKIPLIGDIPFIGKFFQSKSKSKANTELVVTVTPEIVDPIPVGTPLPKPKYPEKFLPPNSNVFMGNPEKDASAITPPTAPNSISIEKLIDSQKDEKVLTEGGQAMSK